MSTNTDLAAIFERAADVMAILGENSFKVLATRKIARLLEDSPRDIRDLSNAGDLEKLPGVGVNSAEKIREYIRTGHISEFEDLSRQVPSGVLAMMNISGLGVKTAAQLWHEAGITTLEELARKLDNPETSGLMKLKGMGAKKIAKIKQNMAFLASQGQRCRLGEALLIAEEFCRTLRELPGVTAAEYCGSLRRGKETIGDIDILICAGAGSGEQISAAIRQHPHVAEVLAAGETKTSFRTAQGLQVDIRVVQSQHWGAALQYFTGSKEHNVRLREIASALNLKLNEWGLFSGEKPIAGPTEEGIYHALDLAMIPPEMREDHDEIELAGLMHQGWPKPISSQFAFLGNPPPKQWISLSIQDIRGDLHMHTTASDGTRSIADMVAAAKRRGYEYIAITDHSKSQVQANGLNTQRLLKHIAAIHAVSREARDILVLAGSEVDILADGSLDYEDDILCKLDWVIASPHSALSQESDAATARLVRAVSHPRVDVLGHPTGRIVGRRRGIEPDMTRVVMAALRSGAALEINANDMRLDLRDSHVRLAVEAGVPLCINTDAHAEEDMEQMQYGILTARRGWARLCNIINARSRVEFERWLASRRMENG